MDVLVINGHDYSGKIKRRGYGWSRNDLDSDKTTRTKDGRMRRDKIATKRKLSYELLPMSKTDLAQLDDDLSGETFSATYTDVHGNMTKTFYCSSLSATLAEVQDGVEAWEGATFTMIEV